MMRRLVERHKGILPLDTAESIWRVIIATFTYVQAPFSVHADLSAGDAAMRDSRALPFRLHGAVRARTSARPAWSPRSRPRRAISASCRPRSPAAAPGGRALEGDDAPKIIARLPFVERADHPAGTAGLRRSRAPLADAMVTRRRDLERARRAAGARRPRARSRRSAEVDRGAGPRLRRRGAAGLGAAGGKHRRASTAALVEAGASVRSTALVGSHATRYTVAADGAGHRAVAATDLESGADAHDRARSVRSRAPACSTSSPMCRARAHAPGVAKVYKLSSNETPLGPSPKAIAAYRGRRRAAGGLSGRLGRPRCARRSAAPYGLDPARIVCGAGSDELLNLLARRLSRPTATRRSTPRTASSSTRSRRSARAASRSWRRRRTTPPTSTRSSRAVTPTHQDRVPRQPEQSDRHLPAVRRGEAAARRPAAARAARARRGLCRICAPQRLRGRHRAGRDVATTS